LVEESLVTVNCPVVGPTIAGRNSTINVAVCPGFKVTGELIPEIVNPLPLTVRALTFTGVDPEEVKTIDCAAEPFTATLPKDTLCALMVKTGPEVPPLWLDPETIALNAAHPTVQSSAALVNGPFVACDIV
jgi:hypothetical protein